MRTSAAPSQIGGSQFVSLVRDEVRKDQSLLNLEYQTGIRSTLAWPTKSHTLRIIPGYDANGVFPQIVPGKPFVMDYDPAEYLTDTFAMVSTVSGFGASKSNVISAYRPGSPEEIRFGGDTVLNCVCEDICRSVMAVDNGKRPAIQPGPTWAAWSKYNPSTKTRPIVSRCRETLFFQALVWELNGNALRDGNGNDLRDGNGNPLPMVYVFGIDNRASIKKLMEALIEPLDPTRPLDGLNNSKYRGPAEKDGSMLFLLPKKETIGNDGKFSNVLVPHVSAAVNNWTVTPFPLSEEQIKSWWRPWDSVLNYLTPEQQCRLVAQELGADTLNYIVANDSRLADLVVPADIAARGLGKYEKSSGQRPASTAASPMSGFGLGFKSAEPTTFVVPSAITKGTPAPAPAAPPAPSAPSWPSSEPSRPMTLPSQGSPDMKAALQGILKGVGGQTDEATELAKELDNVLDDGADTAVFGPLM